MMNKIILKVNAKVLKKSFEDTYGKRHRLCLEKFS